LSDDEILELFADGWKPRRKFTGEHEYIYLRRKTGKKERNLGRMSPRFDWLFEDESLLTVVPETRKTASIAQVQRLKKNLKNFASKEELQKLIERVKKHERAAPRRITVDDVYLCRLSDVNELITNGHTVQEMVDWCVDNFDDDIDKLRKGRVVDQRRNAYLEI